MDTGDIIIMVTICVATLIDIILKSYFSKKADNLATKEDIQEISYESEKGKNLATKEDIQEITNIVESIRSEVSFENQRKHNFIEKRTELFLSVLNNAEEIHRCRFLLSLYVHDHNAEDKIYTLIKKVNDDLRVINYNYRLILASAKQEDLDRLTPLDELTKSTISYAYTVSAKASNAVSAMSNIKRFMKLYIDSGKESSYWQQAMAWDKVLADLQENIDTEFEPIRDDFMEKRSAYFLLLNDLYGRDFHLKYDY